MTDTAPTAMTLKFSSWNELGGRPDVVLGCNSLGLIDEADADRLICAALDRGVLRFDTADVYAGGRSEATLGRFLRGRQDVTVISKFGHPAGAQPGERPCAPAAVRRSCAASLDRLGRDRIDIYLIHFPDRDTPFHITLEAIGELMAEGLVGGWGISNASAGDVAVLHHEAVRLGLAPPALVEAEYHLLSDEAASLASTAASALGIATGAFFPLAGGLLSGRYGMNYMRPGGIRQHAVRNIEERFFTSRHARALEALRTLCDGYGVSVRQIAFAWLAARSDVSCTIMGASSADQLADNLDLIARPLAATLIAEARRTARAALED